MSSNKNHRLVFASDGSHKNLCKTCGLNPCKCRRGRSVASAIVPSEVLIKIRLEKKGRGGKSVSVLFNFPHNPDYFTKLAKKLKAVCGTGGTFKRCDKEDQVELQGDHREKIKTHLEKLGFQVKLAGG